MNKILNYLKSKNKQFYIRIGLNVFTALSFTTVQQGYDLSDLDSWHVVGDVIFGTFKNPYILGLTAINFYQSLKISSKKNKKIVKKDDSGTF